MFFEYQVPCLYRDFDDCHTNIYNSKRHVIITTTTSTTTTTTTTTTATTTTTTILIDVFLFISDSSDP